MPLVMKVQLVGVAETGSSASSGAGNETTVVTWRPKPALLVKVGEV